MRLQEFSQCTLAWNDFCYDIQDKIAGDGGFAPLTSNSYALDDQDFCKATGPYCKYRNGVYKAKVSFITIKLFSFDQCKIERGN